MTYHKLFLILLSFVIFISDQLTAKSIPLTNDDNSIVQIKSTVQYPNFLQPWRFKNPETRRSYGVYVGDGLVLTLTQSLNFATNIEINKSHSLKNYSASIIKMDHDLGLALLKVEDSDFSKGLNTVSFPTDNFLPAQGLVLDYKEYRNLGEKKVRSVKLDLDTYSNGYIELPYIEIQSEEKLEGIGELIIEESSRIPQGLLTSFKDSQNNGKMIPGFMIKQFLECKMKESCTIFKGFRFRPLVEKSTREYYGVKKEDQGIIIAEIYPSAINEKNKLEVEDIILEVAGYKIDPKGYFDHPKYGKILISFLFHANENIGKTKDIKLPIKILRNRKLMEFDFELRTLNQNAIRIPFGSTRNTKPHYLILGGLVFLELSEHYLTEFGNQWRARVNKHLLYLNDYHHIAKTDDEGKILILSQVLPLTGNQSYHSMHQVTLEKVNGKSIKSLIDLKEILSKNTNDFIILDFFDGSQVTFRSDEIQKLNEEALKTFKIPSANNF
ncbi:MAG: serine protease [Leptospira sp.]|nr:serine protease [Leptospira sp.]